MSVTSSPPPKHRFARYQSMHAMNTNLSSPFSSSPGNNTNSRLLPHLQRQRQRTIPNMRSHLSSIDSKFVEFTRCLYQAKTIVQDLSSFHASILPMLSLSTFHDPSNSPISTPHHHLFTASSQSGVGSVAFHRHIKQYLDDNFSKFTKLCKVLMMILSRLEQNAQVKQERVQSFRNEIMEEWRLASDIKRRIHAYLQQNNFLFDGSSGPTTLSTSTESSPSMSTLDHHQSTS